jgi:membrane protease YdiL (CAAX protease family)
VISLFFVLAFVFTWGLQLPAVLAAHGFIAGPPERFMALVGLGAFGPAAAAMVAATVEKTGVRALLRPLGTWRVGVRWYLAALLLPGGIFVVAAVLYNALGHSEPLLYPPDAPAYALAAVVFPLGEEIGWRGFALPRLRDRFGPLPASAIIGVFWTFWHAMMLDLQGASPSLYLVFLPYMVAASVVFTWIYQHTRGSLLLAFLAHVGTHLNNPGHAMPGRATPIVLHTLAYVALAAVLVFVDRRALPAGARRPPKLGADSEAM